MRFLGLLTNRVVRPIILPLSMQTRRSVSGLQCNVLLGHLGKMQAKKPHLDKNQDDEDRDEHDDDI